MKPMEIAVLCRSRSRFARWVHQQVAPPETVFICVLYSSKLTGRRYFGVEVIDAPESAAELEFAMKLERAEP